MVEGAWVLVKNLPGDEDDLEQVTQVCAEPQCHYPWDAIEHLAFSDGIKYLFTVPGTCKLEYKRLFLEMRKLECK